MTVTKTRFRLSDEDRATYGGDEWVTFDPEAFFALSYDELAALERPMFMHDRMSLGILLASEWPGLTQLGVRGLAWLARQMAGATSPAWPDFKPRIMKMTYERVEDAGADAGPPAQGSSEPPSVAKTPRSRRA